MEKKFGSYCTFGLFSQSVFRHKISLIYMAMQEACSLINNQFQETIAKSSMYNVVYI